MAESGRTNKQSFDGASRNGVIHSALLIGLIRIAFILKGTLRSPHPHRDLHNLSAHRMQ